MTIIEFLQAANGDAQLWAADGQFLGTLSSNTSDPNSIINPNTFGNPFNHLSIQNQSWLYGGSLGLYSPYNYFSSNPPVIIYQGQPVLIVTKNQGVETN